MAEAALASAFGFSDVDTFRASRDPGDAGRGTTIDDAPGPVHVPGQSDSSGAMDEWEEEMLSRESAADEDVEAYVAVRLQQQAEVWPSHLQPPVSAAEVIDPDSPWSPLACGVEIRECAEDPSKGMGAFATRRICAGSVVGVYWGERLTMREHALRHGWRTGTHGPQPSRADRRALAARTSRLQALKNGAPMRGARSRIARLEPLRDPGSLIAAAHSHLV